MIDSGAFNSFTRENILNDAEKTGILNTKRVVMVGNNQKMTTIGALDVLMASNNSHESNFIMNVVQEIPVDVILDIDFLKQYECVLDVKNKMIIIGKNQILYDNYDRVDYVDSPISKLIKKSECYLTYKNDSVPYLKKYSNTKP